MLVFHVGDMNHILGCKSNEIISSYPPLNVVNLNPLKSHHIFDTSLDTLRSRSSIMISYIPCNSIPKLHLHNNTQY